MVCTIASVDRALAPQEHAQLRRAFIGADNLGECVVRVCSLSTPETRVHRNRDRHFRIYDHGIEFIVIAINGSLCMFSRFLGVYHSDALSARPHIACCP